ncbi:hypothetical protein LSM04_002985 [Trypanosoma melophagium]|uniref:uncharacterized protein n=1 Tax=Trypanosoma melophagium TaxID=715481 RepID=UPI003519FBE5|nr:hypothetical protein LSM04_002985 [Trypanosoma melophagium]
MSVAPIDRRSELRRRLRSVLHTIDESLSLNGRGMHLKPLSRTRSESPRSKYSSSLVPCVSAWAELCTEQRREELHTQREEAEQLLRTLKLAQERRKLQRHITTEINTSSSSVVLTVPSFLGETEVKEQTEKTGLLSTRQTPPKSSPPLTPPISAIHDVKREHEEKSTGELVVSDGSVLQVAIVEEEARRRLSERRQAEEESLAKLRALRRKVMKQRQEALAQAEAQIEQAESERIAKVMQLEQDVRRSVAEEQERCRITEVELRAMEVHANALATIRSQTGIALPSCVLPVRPPPPVPVPVPLPQTDTAPFPSNYGSSCSCLSPDTAQDYNYHDSSGVKTVTAVGPNGVGLLSSERECSKVMTAIHSTPQRDITTSSAGRLAEAHQSSSHTPHNSGKEIYGEISPSRLFISPKRDLEEEVPLESPQRLSSSSTINITSSSSVLSATLVPEKEDTPHHSLSSTTKPPVRKLISPTLSPHNSSKNNTSELLISMSGAFETLQGRGIVAYALTSEVNVIPVLLRLSADSRELLLHIGRLKRDINPSKPSTKSLVKGSKQVTFSLAQQKEQNEDHEDETGCSMRRIEEIHHFALTHGYLLYPFGSIGADSSGEICGILCGSIARRLLRKLSCTFFARLGGSSYRVFLVSFPTSNHAKGDSTHSSRVINPNASTLLVLQFRNRQDWAAFLMSAGEATRSLNGGVSLTYGRALWILAANLWQRRRSCTHSSLSPTRGDSIETKSQKSRMTCVKHFRMVPQSLLSFSSNPRTGSAHSQHVVFENHKEYERVGMPTRRFVIPAQLSNSSIMKKNNVTNRISNDVVAPHLERGRRFGLRTTTNNISTSSRPTNTPATLMRHNY